MRPILYYCSSNAGKLREFALAAKKVPALNLCIEPLPGLKQIKPPAEDGATFEENAKAKAKYYSQFTPELVFADDSGLEVDALGGQPGVHSARFAGSGATDEDNNNLLLSRLGSIEHRTARFVCVLALSQAGQCIHTFRGAVEGEILREPRGRNGFGYDPLFFYRPFGCSLAEADPKDKLGVSHRGKAWMELIGYLRLIASE